MARISIDLDSQATRKEIWSGDVTVIRVLGIIYKTSRFSSLFQPFPICPIPFTRNRKKETFILKILKILKSFVITILRICVKGVREKEKGRKKGEGEIIADANSQM